MIHELLSTGKENALSGKELAQLLDMELRSITENIEKERRQGQPICASYGGEKPGYYLAANKEQLQEFCKALKHREKELSKTRQAMELIKLATAKE